MITSIHSPNQEVLEYPQNYESILHAQRLYRVRPANSTGYDYLVLVQFNLVNTYFYSRQSLLLVFFDVHVVRQVDKGVCIGHLQVVRFLLNVLSSRTVSSLIVSLGFISIINDFVLFILFTIFFKLFTQIVDTFSGS